MIKVLGVKVQLRRDEIGTARSLAPPYYALGDVEGFNFGLKPSQSTQYERGLKAQANDSTRVNAAVFQISTVDDVSAR